MSINRWSKPLSRTGRRQCFRWKTRDGVVDANLGIRLVRIEDPSSRMTVARARVLAADPNYPPADVINSVADLMARHVRV